jgi:hypothetical protein
MKPLTEVERATLVTFVHSDARTIVQRIMEESVSEFDTSLKNVNPKDKEGVLAAHALYVAAAAFYQSVIDRLNNECSIFQSKPEPTKIFPDLTESILS